MSRQSQLLYKKETYTQSEIGSFFKKNIDTKASSSSETVVQIVEETSSLKRSHVDLESDEPIPPFESDEPIPPLLNIAEKVHSKPLQRLQNSDLDSLPSDPGLRLRISDYHPNDRDLVRRAYLLKGPCQPREHKFAKKNMSGIMRGFVKTWFNLFPEWLEYSVSKEAVFCLCCYLFASSHGSQAGGDLFVEKGFTNWKIQNVRDHVGLVNSEHNKAYMSCQALLNPNQHLRTVVSKKSAESQNNYRIRLQTSVKCIRLLLQQGLSFRGHDESKTSYNPGNFLAVYQYTADNNPIVKDVVLCNAPGNENLTSPEVQKKIVNAFALETTNIILKDLGGSLFSILIDESRDVSVKEQMAIVIRYVDKKGCVIERFIGVVHVNETSALSLKNPIDALFSKYSLSMASLRGQGYDGANNMRGQYNGLQALIIKENESAYYIHCCAHQLQLASVAVAKKEGEIALLFSMVSKIGNLASASCKRRDKLRETQVEKIAEAFDSGEVVTGKGLNQETSLKRPGDTRWSSHYETLVNLIIMFSSVVDVILDVVEDGMNAEQRAEAIILLETMQSFEFIFNLHLMKSILGITNALSKLLQKKDQDIVNAMSLVSVTKNRLQAMRNDGWDELLHVVSSFCSKVVVDVPEMDGIFVSKRRRDRTAGKITNLHHYHAELFINVLDWQKEELGNRFNEVNTELLLCMSCLHPSNSFSAFNKSKLIRLAEFYPRDFSPTDLVLLGDELDTYIVDVRSRDDFLSLDGISSLTKKMVDTKKNGVYPYVYLLLNLSLILPVATATVERAFSAMRIIKSRLRNRMGDEWLNDCLIPYIEKDVLACVDDEAVMKRYQSMGNHRGGL